MTAPFRSFVASSGTVARLLHGVPNVKNPAECEDHAAASRKWFAAMLWRAFPARSENELADTAARALDVSPRQVKNWLRCEHDASLRYVTAVMLLAGAESIFDQVARRR